MYRNGNNYNLDHNSNSIVHYRIRSTDKKFPVVICTTCDIYRYLDSMNYSVTCPERVSREYKGDSSEADS